MKKNRKYIILIIILIAWFCLTYFFVIKKRDEAEYIVMGNDTMFVHQYDSWNTVIGSDEKEKLNWKKFTIYDEDKKIGKYNLWFSEKWYIFDDNNMAINYNGEIFAYRFKEKKKTLKYSINPITNYDYVNYLLSKYNINNTSNPLISNIITIDIDQDGKNEDFYLISNVFIEKTESEKYYTFAFMVKDNKIYMIYKDTNIKDIYSGCQPYIRSFIDINNDGKYEIAFNCKRFSRKKDINTLYEFKDNKFSTIISDK